MVIFHSFLMFFVCLPEGSIRLTSEILGSSQGAEIRPILYILSDTKMGGDSWKTFRFVIPPVLKKMRIQGLVTVPFWEYWTSPYSSHLVDHIPFMVGWCEKWGHQSWPMDCPIFFTHPATKGDLKANLFAVEGDLGILWDAGTLKRRIKKLAPPPLPWCHLGVSNGFHSQVTPNSWMVYFMENPTKIPYANHGAGIFTNICTNKITQFCR